jgi:feruloyl esterase
MQSGHSVALLASSGVVAVSALLLAGCGGGDDDDTPSGPGSVTAQGACDALSGKTIAGAALTAAAVPASGAVPTYCKVNGTIAPSLNFEMRLPDKWNGKLYYGGGGGYNGAIPALSGLNLAALDQGYATVASDSGHQGSGLSAAFALTDTYAAQLFGSLSVPTVMSTALESVTAAYGTPPTRSYFEGCSNGGREALMNVQRYPNLFDGVIARAPAYNWVGFMGAFNRTAKALAAPGGAFSAAKTQLLSKAIRDACDDLDGIADGVVSNQAACTAAFDPATLRCPGGADTGNTCLSDAQLAVVTSWTTDAVFTGSPTFRNAGWSLTGNEDDPGAWAAWETGNGTVTNAAQYLFQDTTVKNYLARDPNADSLTYAPWDQDQNALYALAALNDATNAVIRPFMNSGGKLILWHGGNDPALSKNATAEYVDKVKTAVGGTNNADAFMRFYVAPGVNHCSGGPGADTTDLLAALDQWVIDEKAPGTLTAEKLDPATGEAVFARPLCRYPKYPRYTGPAGDAQAAKLATNYTCS